MTVRTQLRLSVANQEVKLQLDKTLSPEAQGRLLAEIAREVLVESQNINTQVLGYTPPHDTYVDGGKRSDVGELKPSSKVTFEFKLVFEVLQWIDAQLILASPYMTGRFARSHVWFAEETEMDVTNPEVAKYYVALNAQPYARAIERGESKQAPEGVYEAAALLAARRFGNVAYIRFGYRSFPGGDVSEWAQTHSARRLAQSIRGGRKELHHDWLTRQPAVIVTPER